MGFPESFFCLYHRVVITLASLILGLVGHIRLFSFIFFIIILVFSVESRFFARKPHEIAFCIPALLLPLLQGGGRSSHGPISPTYCVKKNNRTGGWTQCHGWLKILVSSWRLMAGFRQHRSTAKCIVHLASPLA